MPRLFAPYGATALAALAVLVVAVASAVAPHGPALPDEFVYLATARYFGETGNLDSRFYNAAALAAQGYPHADMHPPGYVLVLGAFGRLVPSPVIAAVLVNAAALIAGALLVRSLAVRLGLEARRAFLAGGLFLAVPCTILYVFWALPEVLVVVVSLAVLRAAASPRGAVVATLGVWLAAGLLIRESVVFVLPAALALVRPRRHLAPAALVSVSLFLLVVVPLSRHRGEGGTNFWRATGTNSAVSFSALRAGLAGDLRTASAEVGRRLRTNLAVLRNDYSPTEKAILALYLGIAVLGTMAGWRRKEWRAYTVGLALGTFALATAMAAFFDVPPWTGARYALVLVPPFLPLVAAVAGYLPVVCLVVGSLLSAKAQTGFTAYKESRHERQRRLTAYVDRYVPAGVSRIALDSGYHYGLAHYPVEVIAGLPEDAEGMRRLEEVVWFDYLVVGAEAGLRRQIDKKERYERVNLDDTEAPLIVFRRRR